MMSLKPCSTIECKEWSFNSKTRDSRGFFFKL